MDRFQGLTSADGLSNDRPSSTDCFESRKKFILFCLIALLILLGDNRTWISMPTWLNGKGSIFATLAVLLSGILMLIYCIRTQIPMKAAPLLPIASYLIFLAIGAHFGFEGKGIAMRSVILIVPMYAFLSLGRKDKILGLYSLSLVFSIIMALSALFFFCRIAGIDFPGFVLEPSNVGKAAKGLVYEISILGGSLINNYGNYIFCGIFDEAGALGTFCAILSIAIFECRDYFKLRFGKLIVSLILFSGFLSFSSAFVILIGIYILYRLVITGRVQTLIPALLLIIVLLFALTVDVQNLGQLGSLQTRLQSFIQGDGFGNNRVNDQTVMIMQSFYTSNDLFTQFFGFGHGAFYAIANLYGVDGCSVEFYLFDYGYLGFALYYLVIFWLSKVGGGDRGMTLPVLLAFLLSTYQRPEIFSTLYLAILVFGQSGLPFQSSPKLIQKPFRGHRL